jgi:hypothetical protein
MSKSRLGLSVLALAAFGLTACGSAPDTRDAPESAPQVNVYTPAPDAPSASATAPEAPDASTPPAPDASAPNGSDAGVDTGADAGPDPCVVPADGWTTETCSSNGRATDLDVLTSCTNLPQGATCTAVANVLCCAVPPPAVDPCEMTPTTEALCEDNGDPNAVWAVVVACTGTPWIQTEAGKVSRANGLTGCVKTPSFLAHVYCCDS